MVCGAVCVIKAARHDFTWRLWFCAAQDIIERVGADTVRLFVLFKAPPEAAILWDTKGAS